MSCESRISPILRIIQSAHRSRFLIVGYEKETFGTSMLYPDIPKGRNKCLHRFTHIAFWFEWSEWGSFLDILADSSS